MHGRVICARYPLVPSINDFLLYNIRKQVMGGTSGAYHANLAIDIEKGLADAF